MVYPPQTSLIPVVLAVTGFVQAHGWWAIYPNWYLGVPVRFLAGPVLPQLLLYLQTVFPWLSFFELTYGILATGFLVQAFGWGLLAGRLAGVRGVRETGVIGMTAGAIYLALPWKYLSALALSNPVNVLAESLVPFALISLEYYFTQKTYLRAIPATLFISLALLISTSVIPVLLVGAAALAWAAASREKTENQGTTENFVDRLKDVLPVLISAFVLVTFWYTPQFWWTILSNPSIGGASGWTAIWQLIGFAKAALPVAAAIWVVKLGRKSKGGLMGFALIWLLTFAILTVYRLILNPDFWQDWTSWFAEIEVGIALLLAGGTKEIRGFRGIGGAVALFYLPWLLTLRIYAALGTPPLLSPILPPGLDGLSALNFLVGDQGRVFLSGTPVFWADNLYGLDQVRGGRDEVSQNPVWAMASYQIREGKDADIAGMWLKILGVRAVLVEGSKSTEYYHDFKNLDKWDELGKLVWSGNGETVYEFEGNNLAWAVDKNAILNIKHPQTGNDRAVLKNYLSAWGKPLPVKKTTEGWEISSEGSSCVLLLVNFSPGIHAYSEKGELLGSSTDGFGMMVIQTEGAKQVTVKQDLL